MPEVITFKDAVAQGTGRKHALLGNGFSRACRNDIFAYGKLFERADFSKLSPSAKDAFNILDTTDFEVVMEALKRAAKLVKLYAEEHGDLAGQFELDADGLREVLVSAIAESHPERPGDVDAHQYQACKTFLASFDDIYSINYDLLLYWALMQDEIKPDVGHDDGFRQPDDGPQPWVTWDSSAHDQSVYYLHGALHIYEAGPEIQKYTWCNTQLALIDQIRAALKAEKYPLFVAEGSSEQKMSRIIRSSFLGRAYRSFENIGGSLYAYGLSMSDSDNHILRAIARNKVERLFVSVYGDPSDEANRTMIERASHLPTERKASGRRKNLDVVFYDAATAHVWE